MTYRYWLHRMFFLSILTFRVDCMCNVSRHAKSRKAEKLKHIYAQLKYGIKPLIFAFFLNA